MTNDTQERPVLLLDIDGVLNLIPRPLWDEKGKRVINHEPIARDHVEHRTTIYDEGLVTPYRLRIPADAVALVSQLAEVFDIHWYTMWNEAAVRVFGPLAGLPAMPYFECDWFEGGRAMDASGAPDWMRKELWKAKTPLIEKHIGQRPFCWIDDDTNPADIWYLDDYAEVGPFRLITVEPETGLTQAVVDEALAWAAGRLSPLEEIAS